MRIVIIEPHPDDAMLNCWGIITTMVGSGHSVAQLTMTEQKEDPREALVPLYGKRFMQLNMGHEGIDWTLKGRRAYADEFGPEWNTPDMLRAIFEKQNLMSWEQAVKDGLEAIGHADMYLMPVGQIHPMHIMVREEFGKQIQFHTGSLDDVLLYKEYPYWTRVRGTRFEQMVERLGLEEANRIYLTDETLRRKCEHLEQSYPLGYLYLVKYSQSQEMLREELLYTCTTTDS